MNWREVVVAVVTAASAVVGGNVGSSGVADRVSVVESQVSALRLDVAEIRRIVEVRHAP